jgi:hypothetical protein
MAEQAAPEAHFTIKEFAALSTIPVPTLHRYLRKGLLPKFQPAGKGGRVSIPASALVAVPKRGAVAAPAGKQLAPSAETSTTMSTSRCGKSRGRWRAK